MGRRGTDPTDDARWVFNRLAVDYAARPGYPESLVARLAALAGGPGARVADVGAGVGHLALPLAARGLRVAAVEPARAMIASLAGAARAAQLELDALHAAAEATGLPDGSVDLAVLADAAQWVDPDAGGRELARVVRPGGVVAIVEARLAATPFLAELQALLAGANFKAGRRPAGAAPMEARAAQLLAVAGGHAARSERFTHDEPLTPARLDAVLRSLSFLGPALGPAAREETLARARALAAAHGGARWTRELTLTWARTRGAAGRASATTSSPP